MRLCALALLMTALPLAAAAQPPMPVPRPDPAAAPAALAQPDPKSAARDLFGRSSEPAPMVARAIGFYTRGCLAGAVALPVDGENWQAMRLSRNRNWGHPDLIAMLERLAAQAPTVANWPGILVGDLAQPRGGPMLSGHASHQLGLDADIWLTPMPDRRLSREEREKMSATMIVRSDRRDVDPAAWTPGHTPLIKAAAQDPAVERVLVNAAIKKALCREAGEDRGWLAKVRPWWGHDYHMHVRIGCPAGSGNCEAQDPVPAGDGCGQELEGWFREAIINPPPPKDPPKPRPPITLSQLPDECRQVLIAR